MKFFDWLVEAADNTWAGIKYIVLFKWLWKKNKTDWSKVIPNIQVGDIGLIDQVGLFSDGIEFFESLSGSPSKVAHCFMVISNDGKIVEALADGIKEKNITKYFREDTRLVIRRFKEQLDATEKGKIMNKANSMIGQKYDYKQFAGLACLYILCFLFGRNAGLKIADRFKVYRGNEGQVQCSTLCAASYEAAGRSAALNVDLDRVTPKVFYDSYLMTTVIDIKGSENE
jgi:hypothetical protein